MQINNRFAYIILACYSTCLVSFISSKSIFYQSSNNVCKGTENQKKYPDARGSN